ncbi:MAG: hypothetical protein JXQ83_00605, partial [Candidatus Glassbacteria bacterium]|nr:hypothetical protein [Candidatus Glassbacteria bacterium]
YGDWSYNLCRAYSVWGGLAAHGGSVSGRRLMKDGIPPELEKLHAINCFQPADRPAWANFGAPGLVCSATGINEFGYLFALHDHCSDRADTTAGLLTRSGACALISRAAGPDEAEALLLANPGGTGSYLLFWGGAGGNTGGAVFCYGAAGRLHGGSQRLHRRNPCPEVLGGTALTCGNDSYPVSHDDCGLGGHAAELVSHLEIPAYTLAQAEQPLAPGSYHSVYAEARSRREIDFYMWARVEGRQVRTADLSWDECFRHSPPVPERLPLRLGRGADSLALALEDRGPSDAALIRFDLPAEGYLNLSLFDRDGDLVRTLVNHRLQQGAYSVEWDRSDNLGESLSPGDYLLRLRNARGIVRKACRIE